MESYLKIFLTLTAVLVGNLSAPVPQNPQSKLRVAPCPQVKTGKYIVMLRDVVSGEGDQKTFLGYMEIMTKTDSDDTQVSKTPVTEKPTDAEVSEEDKKPSVKSYQDLGFGMYSVDMNELALKEVLEMADVDFVEEDTMVFGASPCDKESGSGSGSEGQNQIMLG